MSDVALMKGVWVTSVNMCTCGLALTEAKMSRLSIVLRVVLYIFVLKCFPIGDFSGVFFP
jgi:hypothetical protein